MGYKSNKKTAVFSGLKKVTRNGGSVLFAVVIALTGSGGSIANAAAVTQVSTGPQTACAVADGKVSCWGSNQYGQLGNNTKTNSSTPVSVANNASAIAADPGVCSSKNFLQQCTAYSRQPSDAKPASPLGNKYVTKVSVGKTHTCALADARVYCWGDNKYGQLGNRSNTDSLIPVSVDIQTKDIAATSTVPNPCGGWGNPSCKAVKQDAKPKSALSQKEIVDIAAGESFTCALSSDGSTACWGTGANGRLGTNSTTDANYPRLIYMAGVLNGKKGVKLAKAAGATMCELAVDSTTTANSTAGNPYCWGYGIDGGEAIPADSSQLVPCNASSPTNPPSKTPYTTTFIFESHQPVQVPSDMLTSMDGDDYVTGQSTTGRAYYWGMYGYVSTSAYTNIISCRVDACTADAGNRISNRIVLALSADQARSNAQHSASNSNSAGGDKNKNLNSNNAALSAAQRDAAGGISTSVGFNNNTGSYTYSTNIGTGAFYNATAQSNGQGGVAFNINNWAGTARPSTIATQSANVGNNKAATNCGIFTHYGFTRTDTNVPSGQRVATTPPSWPQNYAGFKSLSGNAYNGLFCATTANGTQCDAHSTSITEGQTGSNYTKQCTTSGSVFKTTACAPDPTGPQTVFGSGWLAGKSIQTLDTGTTGYTCAIASGGLGCWGVNDKGQLGIGNTTDKNVPSAVSGF